MLKSGQALEQALEKNCGLSTPENVQEQVGQAVG